MTTHHNHGLNYGVIVTGCTRCAELQAKPYVLKFKRTTDRRIQRIPVATIAEAANIYNALLPATFIGYAVLQNRSGSHIRHIFR